jgi:hypothetical protein
MMSCHLRLLDRTTHYRDQAGKLSINLATMACGEKFPQTPIAKLPG